MALTPAVWSLNLSTGEEECRLQMQSLLSLPPLASWRPSGDQRSPHTCRMPYMPFSKAHNAVPISACHAYAACSLPGTLAVAMARTQLAAAVYVQRARDDETAHTSLLCPISLRWKSSGARKSRCRMELSRLPLLSRCLLQDCTLALAVALRLAHPAQC